MQIPRSKIIGTPVFVDGPRPIALIQDVIVDPDSGRVVAFVVNGHQNLVIVPLDIISWKSGIRINDRSCVIEAEDVVRVNEVLTSDRPMQGQKVETEDGVYLGKVYDYSIDDKKMALDSLYTAKGILILFLYEKRQIPAGKIVEVTAEKIIVKNSPQAVKAEEKGRGRVMKSKMVNSPKFRFKEPFGTDRS